MATWVRPSTRWPAGPESVPRPSTTPWAASRPAAGVYDVSLAGDDEPGDADLRAFADTAERQRATGTAMVARHVARRFGLRPGLTVQEAGDALLGPGS